MKLIASNQPNLDLSSQPGVTGVFCHYTVGGEISIHLCCEKGDEQTVIDNLPAWVGQKMKVTKSHMHVFLKAKVINN